MFWFGIETAAAGGLGWCRPNKQQAAAAAAKAT